MMRGASRAIRSARLTWQRLLKDERGSVLAFFVAIPVIAGTVAVGVETGQLYRTKRQMQGAADAAALAGAIDRMAGKDNATIAATARYEAQRNGFQNGVSGVTVTVNAPPTSGSNVSATGAVEVIVTKSTSFALAKVLSSSLGNAFTLTSRSVAAQSTVTSTSNQQVTTSTTTSTSSKDGCLVALTTAADTRSRSWNRRATSLALVSGAMRGDSGSRMSPTGFSGSSVSRRVSGTVPRY